MSTIVTRAGKGSALTHTEVDANFTNLNTDKIEAAQSVTLTNKTISGSNNTLSNIGNSSLTNSSVTIGSTSVSLGSTATTVSGLTLSSPTISGGTVNNASVGATTPSTGAFTTLSATGVATFQAGSNSAPAITTSGDTNTGIFFPAADTVAIGTGGTERLRVDSAGNAGLGVTPSAWSASFRALQVSNFGLMVNPTNGNTYQLANAYFDTGYKYLTSAAALRFEMVGGVFAWSTAPSGTAGNAITFTQAMTLDASGNLVLGTTASLSSAANRIDLTINGTSSAMLSFGTGGTRRGYAVHDGTDFTIASETAGALRFLNNGSESARITSGGSLIVGGTSVSFAGAMSEFQQSSGDCYVSINRTGTLSNGQQAAIYAVGGSRQASTFVYKHSGITNPCGALNLQCEDAAQNYLWADNADVLRISTAPTNVGTTGGTVVGTQTSDERLKNIFGAISYGLTEVMALQPISFAMKDDPETAKIGFSAQQVQPIIPESVYDTGECIDGYDVDLDNKLITTPKSDRTKLAMEYTQLIPVLTKAIQELNAKVEAQAAEIAALKGNA